MAVCRKVIPLQSVSVLCPKIYQNFEEAWHDIFRFVSARVFCETCDERISESLRISQLTPFRLYELAGVLELNPKNTLCSETARTIQDLIETNKILLQNSPMPIRI